LISSIASRLAALWVLSTAPVTPVSEKSTPTRQFSEVIIATKNKKAPARFRSRATLLMECQRLI
jgi:hypothetical protein